MSMKWMHSSLKKVTISKLSSDYTFLVKVYITMTTNAQMSGKMSVFSVIVDVNYAS